MTALTACQYCRKVTPCDCADPDGPTTRAQFAEALTNQARTATRCIQRVGNDQLETPWDRIHKAINENLTLWELAE